MEIDAVDKIKSYIKEHNISIEELADELYVNTDFLQNVFDKKYIFIDSLDIDYIYEALLRLTKTK